MLPERAADLAGGGAFNSEHEQAFLALPMTGWVHSEPVDQRETALAQLRLQPDLFGLVLVIRRRTAAGVPGREECGARDAVEQVGSPGTELEFAL